MKEITKKSFIEQHKQNKLYLIDTIYNIPLAKIVAIVEEKLHLIDSLKKPTTKIELTSYDTVYQKNNFYYVHFNDNIQTNTVIYLTKKE